MIADEVGVGKTVEAGLILKELSARSDLKSVLVICPKSLVTERKWELELKRFDETFTPLDGPTVRQCLQETYLNGEWPNQYEKCIMPFSLFDSQFISTSDGRRKGRQPGLLDLDPPPAFDLVIVDEAHHIRNPETFLHQGVRYFCDNAKAVLFLTATPVQLGSTDLFTLLNVLRPDLIIDENSFNQMAEPNKFINAAIDHCRIAEPGWEKAARNCLSDITATKWGRRFLCQSPDFQTLFDDLGEADTRQNRVKLFRI